MTAADAATWGDGAVLMTEKDAVKCAGFARPTHWYLPVEARPEAAFVASLEHAWRGSFVDKKLLDILVCPLCKGPLYYDKTAGELICRADRLAFPIRDDIPIMLEEEARVLAADEEVPKA